MNVTSQLAKTVNKETILMWNSMFMFGLLSMKSTLSSASQWKHLRKRSRAKIPTNLAFRSSLNTVKARQVSVTAYQALSIRCSSSAALRVPKNIFRISLPTSRNITRNCT